MKKRFTIQISRDFGILLVLGILITLSIINKNEFGAAIKFIYVPVCITIFYYLFLINYSKKFKRHHILLLLIFITSSLSTLLYVKDLSSIVSSLLASFLWSLLCALLTSIKYDQKTIVRIINIYTVIAVLLSINTLYSFASGMVGGKSYRVVTTIFGVRKDNNFYASFLTPIFAYGFYRFTSISKNRLVFFFVSILLFLAIFFTGSRAAFISILLIIAVIIAGFIFNKRMSGKKIVMLFMVICIISIVFSYISTNTLFERFTNIAGYSSNIRIRLWREALNAFFEHPILGAGRGAANLYALNALGNYVHNTYLEILCDQGIIGIVLFIALFTRFIKVKPKNLVFMVAICIGFFVPLLFISAYQTFGFWFSISFCIILSEYLREKSVEDLFEVEG